VVLMLLYSRHSGIMHFSTSNTSAPQMDPSAGGVFTVRSLLFTPGPHVALQTSHSPHSVTRQLLGAEDQRGGRRGAVNRRGLVGCRAWAEAARRGEKSKLTALVVDHAVLRLLRGQGAHGAVIGELLRVTLPGACARPTGQRTGRPADPLGQHAGRSL